MGGNTDYEGVRPFSTLQALRASSDAGSGSHLAFFVKTTDLWSVLRKTNKFSLTWPRMTLFFLLPSSTFLKSGKSFLKNCAKIHTPYEQDNEDSEIVLWASGTENLTFQPFF